jgi:hypothetical protein
MKTSRSSIFKTELRRAVLSREFCIAVIGATCAALAGSWSIMSDALGGAIMERMGEISIQVSYSGMFSRVCFLVFPIICTLPFSASFVEDMESRFLRAYMLRTTRAKYIRSKIAATAIAGGLAIAAGMCLLLIIFSIVFPPLGVMPYANPQGYSYGIYFIGVLLVSLGGATWALFGGFASAALRNRYLAYAMPFILYYVLVVFQERYWSSSYALSPREWVYPEHLHIAAAFLMSGGAIAACAAGYAFIMRRRITDV